MRGPYPFDLAAVEAITSRVNIDNLTDSKANLVQ